MVISRILQHNITFNPINEICGDSPVEQSDCELMIAAANDDMEAYNKLYAKYRKPLYNFILRHVLNAQTANVVQDPSSFGLCLLPPSCLPFCLY